MTITYLPYLVEHVLTGVCKDESIKLYKQKTLERSQKEQPPKPAKLIAVGAERYAAIYDFLNYVYKKEPLSENVLIACSSAWTWLKHSQEFNTLPDGTINNNEDHKQVIAEYKNQNAKLALYMDKQILKYKFEDVVKNMLQKDAEYSVEFEANRKSTGLNKDSSGA